MTYGPDTRVTARLDVQTELLERIHDLLLINHIDAQRNYDLLFAIATGQDVAAVSAMYEKHAAGEIFAPPPALPEEDENGS